MSRSQTLTFSRDGNWSNGQLLLITTAEVDDDPIILQKFKGTDAGALHWQSALNKEVLRLLPNGSVEENGKFWFCLKNESYPAWGLMISLAGRIRDMTSLELKLLHC